MRTDLAHLPDKKRRDLVRVVEILFAEFAEAIGIATAKWKKAGRILKIVLYGSYARGDGSRIRSVAISRITIS